MANVLSPHGYVKTAEEAVAVTLKAGMDVDCSYFVGQHGVKALQMGLINESLIDARLSNLFKVRMRLQVSVRVQCMVKLCSCWQLP